jgi:putative copper export protein
VHALYVFSVWLHILAATLWIGGMGFLVLVVVPWLRSDGRQIAGLLLRKTGPRFRTVGWTCFAVLVVTGAFNLWVRGVRLASFADPSWLGSPFGKAVVAKLMLFTLVVLVSAHHDFVVGPKATAAIESDPTSPATTRLRAQAQRAGRLNALFALVLVGIAVTLVRGSPW